MLAFSAYSLINRKYWFLTQKTSDTPENNLTDNFCACGKSESGRPKSGKTEFKKQTKFPKRPSSRRPNVQESQMSKKPESKMAKSNIKAISKKGNCNKKAISKWAPLNDKRRMSICALFYSVHNNSHYWTWPFWTLVFLEMALLLDLALIMNLAFLLQLAF